MNYRCPLGRLIPNSPDTEKIKRDGWQQHGILVVSAENENLDYYQKEAVKQIGNKLYGERVI